MTVRRPDNTIVGTALALYSLNDQLVSTCWDKFEKKNRNLAVQHFKKFVSKLSKEDHVRKGCFFVSLRTLRGLAKVNQSMDEGNVNKLRKAGRKRRNANQSVSQYIQDNNYVCTYYIYIYMNRYACLLYCIVLYCIVYCVVLQCLVYIIPLYLYVIL
jgi:hypothetical protein